MKQGFLIIGLIKKELDSLDNNVRTISGNIIYKT